MFTKLPEHYAFSKNVFQARRLGAPLVALESAVITHGLPAPENRQIASDMAAEVQKGGATPAIIALLDGKIKIGLTEEEIDHLVHQEKARKISLRDFGIALARELSGGTTVAATLFVSSLVGIRVFATGGIGGVHRGAPFDVSADLTQLGKSQVLVVCAGAKAILDLPATREVLETQGVPVIGYRTDEFPAFYSRQSGLSVDIRVETPEEAAGIARNAWEAGLESGVLLVVPPPEEAALPGDAIESAIQEALHKAEQSGVHGGETTPFLLEHVNQLTGGASMRANLALLRNNARIAGQVAAALGGIKSTVNY